MRITVRCFASVREILGSDRLEVELPEGASVRVLKELLAQRAPDFGRLRLACAVNCAYAAPDRTLADGDEVALIPPISGGSPAVPLFRFDLVEGPLDPRKLEAECRTDADGAMVTFAGVTRSHHDGRAVRGLRYEAFGEMAAAMMVELFEQTFRRFEISRARVAHRLGQVPVGEASVLVVVAAQHRAAAFDACRLLMDRLKAELPVFKKEVYTEGGGDSRWIGDLPAGTPEL